MLPDAAHPERGRFVRDQVEALRRLPAQGAGGALEIELYEFPPGAPALLAAARELHRRYGGRRGGRVDVVHAHFGLTAWPALAVRARVRGLTVHGTDVRHPRTRVATRAALPLMDLVAAPTAELARELPDGAARGGARVLPGGAARGGERVLPGGAARERARVLLGGAARERARVLLGGAARGGVRVLPCGVDLERFRPLPRAAARAELGLDPDRPHVLFPADPTRAGKRYDRAVALTDEVARHALGGGPPTPRTLGEVPPTPQTLGRVPPPLHTHGGAAPALHTLGGVPPERVPLWVNAANAVVVPSAAEGFGLAVLEALACDVPVLATPVGVHAQALEGVKGALCAPFGVESWRVALEPHLRTADPRIAGRSHAEPFSAEHMAQRLAEAWRELLAGKDQRNDARGG